MLDLSSGERRSLGSARHAVWVDAEHFGVILPGGNQWELVTVSTGERVALSGPAKGVYPGTRLSEAGGFRLEAVPTDPEHGYPYEYTAYRVVDITGRLAPLEFDAVDVRLTADGKLFLLTAPVDLKPQIGAFIGPAAKRGMSNLFEVDPRTGVGRWIASAEISTWGTTLAANEQYVAWTENYCNISPQLHASDGNTRVYKRANGKLIELDQGLYVTAITPDGELAAGTFGADALIDIESLSYTVKFDARDRAWSPDFRYTAVGMTGGHGGVCGA